MSLLKRIYAKLLIGNIKEMDDEPDVDKWLAFLKTLPEPKDEVDEAYNKYRCRAYHYPAYKTFILNIGALPMAVLSYGCFFRKKRRLPSVREASLLVERKTDVDYADIFPSELAQSYDRVMEVVDSRNQKELLNVRLSLEAVQLYWKTVKRHPFSLYFQFWTARELSKHCSYISQYNPSATAVYIEERNIAGPLLRRLYESTGRQYISFMHGEYLLRLIQGYMSFSAYYIWDQEYENIFSEILHCHIGRYILYKPRKLEKKWHFEGIVPEYYCTYYFSAESKESIRKLSEVFAQLEKKGHKCKVRPHPRYSQWEIIRETFPADRIEDPRQVSIEQSLSSTRYVVGLATTVLAEGYYEGKEIVVDDITSLQKYANLEKRHFLVLKRPHLLLSNLLKDDEEKT